MFSNFENVSVLAFVWLLFSGLTGLVKKFYNSLQSFFGK